MYFVHALRVDLSAVGPQSECRYGICCGAGNQKGLFGKKKE